MGEVRGLPETGIPEGQWRARNSRCPPPGPGGKRLEALLRLTKRARVANPSSLGTRAIRSKVLAPLPVRFGGSPSRLTLPQGVRWICTGHPPRWIEPSQHRLAEGEQDRLSQEARRQAQLKGPSEGAFVDRMHQDVREQRSQG